MIEVTDSAVESVRRGQPLVAGTQTLGVGDPAPFAEKDLNLKVTVAGKLHVALRANEAVASAGLRVPTLTMGN